MGALSWMRLPAAAFLLVAVMEATYPAGAQNLNDLLRIFGGDKQRAARQAQAEWRRLPPAEVACIDQRMRRKGSGVEALIRRGVKPSATRLIELRSSCREFVGGVQVDTAPALARDAAGSPPPTVPPSNPIQPKDAGVTSAAAALRDSNVTLPSPEKTAGQVAEEQMQQGDVEPKNSVPERGTMGWPSALLFALLTIATLVGIVRYLFIRWRTTGQRTVAVSIPEKNFDGAGSTSSETTIGAAGEAVKPLADKMIQQATQTGDAVRTSMTQDSAESSSIQPTHDEGFPEIASIEGSKSSSTGNTGNTAVENVAQLAELCAKGMPSEKDFQRIKGLISQSVGSAQEQKV
jgi:hypothetical protein